MSLASINLVKVALCSGEILLPPPPLFLMGCGWDGEADDKGVGEKKGCIRRLPFRTSTMPRGGIRMHCFIPGTSIASVFIGFGFGLTGVK
jgi:hypothetical protein